MSDSVMSTSIKGETYRTYQPPIDVSKPVRSWEIASSDGLPPTSSDDVLRSFDQSVLSIVCMVSLRTPNQSILPESTRGHSLQEDSGCRDYKVVIDGGSE